MKYNPETMDTTQCREALEALGVDFPRGSRLPELRALLKTTQSRQTTPAPDKSTQAGA